MNKNIYLLFAIVFFAFNSCRQQKKEDSILLTNWKFKTGDSLIYAKMDFDDSSWDSIQTGKSWEYQGYKQLDGFAWYRVHFFLSDDLKTNAFFKDTIQITIGRVDDGEETYLNGERIGINGISVSAKDSIRFGKEINWSVDRNYKLSVNDSRLQWGKDNVIAVRVQDNGGDGGLYYGTTSVSMRGVKDYVEMDLNSKAIEKKADSTFEGFVCLKNKSGFADFSGKLEVKIIDCETKIAKSSTDYNVELKKEDVVLAYSIPKIDSTRYKVEINFIESKSNYIISKTKELPYILTPKSNGFPKINGAKILGATPGKPILFKIPVSGVKPISYSVENLPDGLILDAVNGIISGSVKKAGEYLVKLNAKNDKGEVTRELKIVIGDKLCLTPPMGWNSWNCWGLSVDEAKMKSSVDVFIAAGLADHGYAYVNIDDGWEDSTRQKNGTLLPNKKFGNMKNLSDYVHSKGLKIGIYSSPGSTTCGGYLGSLKHELDDAKSYAAWGIDYLKYDWCSYFEVYSNPKGDELLLPYRVMREALNKVNRDIVYSVCQYGMGNVWEWGGSVGGQLWRTTGDIVDTWQSLSNIGFSQDPCASYAKPGSWNDPDMLIVGWVGWGPSLHPTNLTPNEQYTHISLWALLSAPLLTGCDLTRLDDFTLNLLTNDEVIDIDQDLLGKQAVSIVKEKGYTIYVKELEDGSKAIGLFNLDTEDKIIAVDWKQLNISGEKNVRDVWRQKELGKFADKFQSNVPAHGVVLIKIK